jgi:hypothetical protein
MLLKIRSAHSIKSGSKTVCDTIGSSWRAALRDFARSGFAKKEEVMKISYRTTSSVWILAALIVAWQPSQSTADETARSRWTKQAPIPTWFSLQGIAALSPTECWIASAPLLDDVGELAHTTNAGRTWTVVSVDRQVNAVAFIDSLHGWAAGNAFFHTTDGGQTWIKDNSFGTVYDLFFLDTLHGWASGNGSVNYYTTDGGLHWTAFPLRAARPWARFILSICSTAGRLTSTDKSSAPPMEGKAGRSKRPLQASTSS